MMLEVRHRDPRRLPRVVPARVIWVRRPQAYRSLYHDRLSDRITASSELRKAVLESPISAGKLSEASDQMIDQSELPNDPPSTRDAPDPVQPNARQRRAAKRARKMQKVTP
jgi:hypothetical protein